MPVEEGAPTIAGVTFLRRFGPALAIMVVIFLASAAPGDDLPDFGLLDLPMKKGGHALGYALLGIAYLWSLSPNRGPARAGLAVLAVGLAALYGASDELHQALIPGRGPSGLDVLIDTAGALVGVASRQLWASLWPSADAASP